MVSWVSCQIPSSIPHVFCLVYSLICQATSLVTEGSEVYLVPLEPTLCARIVAFWVVTNHSSDDFSKNLVEDQQSVHWCCRILGFFSLRFSFLSFWKWEFYFLHLQSFGTSSVSPSSFTRRKIQEQLTFKSRLHLHCFSDGSSHFCQCCGKPLATVMCVCCCKLIQIS